QHLDQDLVEGRLVLVVWAGGRRHHGERLLAEPRQLLAGLEGGVGAVVADAALGAVAVVLLGLPVVLELRPRAVAPPVGHADGQPAAAGAELLAGRVLALLADVPGACGPLDAAVVGADGRPRHGREERRLDVLHGQDPARPGDLDLPGVLGHLRGDEPGDLAGRGPRLVAARVLGAGPVGAAVLDLDQPRPLPDVHDGLQPAVADRALAVRLVAVFELPELAEGRTGRLPVDPLAVADVHPLLVALLVAGELLARVLDGVLRLSAAGLDGDAEQAVADDAAADLHLVVPPRTGGPLVVRGGRGRGRVLPAVLAVGDQALAEVVRDGGAELIAGDRPQLHRRRLLLRRRRRCRRLQVAPQRREAVALSGRGTGLRLIGTEQRPGAGHPADQEDHGEPGEHGDERPLAAASPVRRPPPAGPADSPWPSRPVRP